MDDDREMIQREMLSKQITITGNRIILFPWD